MAHIVKGIASAVRPNLLTFAKYARVELTPPSPRDIPAISSGIKNLLSAARTGKWKNITVREAWLNALITTEIICWFYVGECIGRRSYIGYDVKV